MNIDDIHMIIYQCSIDTHTRAYTVKNNVEEIIESYLGISSTNQARERERKRKNQVII